MSWDQRRSTNVSTILIGRHVFSYLSLSQTPECWSQTVFNLIAYLPLIIILLFYFYTNAQPISHPA